ncbi:MAG TPA: U32 family peptidase [Methanoculleus sp.]|nr:U32 family peptidase [Methanoculleus sp.]
MHDATPELLAPAGSFDVLRTAVAAGADAVYLSGKRFGARRYAVNFDDEELCRAIAFCHLRGVRVYVTLNVLVTDDELAEVARRLLWLYRIGVDAVLVQDAGVAVLARSIVPGLPVHASTQMTVLSREGALRAAQLGMRRVVLARELPLEEIHAIAAHLPLDRIGLEIFVHGALCYCYSGQCLFSSMVGGRSGNRGMCAQPCRKPYRLVRGSIDAFGRPVHLRTIRTRGRYLLSPRDLAVYPRLDRLARAPVESFKIEGRMRSEAYVGTVVDVYRRALDAIGQGAWTPSEDDELALLLAFNRNFTCGYLLGDRGGALMGPDRPDHRGVRIGTVTGYDGRTHRALIRVKGNLTPEPGDGIVIEGGTGGREVGMVVRRVETAGDEIVAIRVPKAVAAGSAVSLTRRESLTRRAPSPRNPLSVDLSFSLRDGVPVVGARTSAAGGTEVAVCVEGSLPMEPARTRPIAAGRIEELLRRSGDSPLAVREVAMHYSGGLFAPISEITGLRRAAMASLEAAIVETWQPGDTDVAGAEERCRVWTARLEGPAAHPAPRRAAPLLSAYADSIDALCGAAEGGCRRIYFEPTLQADGCALFSSPETFLATIADAAERCGADGAELVWKWPRICRRAFLDRAVPLLEPVREAGVSGIMVEEAGAATAIRLSGCAILLHGSVGLNVWNHLAAGGYRDLFSTLTLSPELDRARLHALVSRVRAAGRHLALEYLVQGPAELMVTEDALVRSAAGRNSDDDGQTEPVWWGVQDERGYTFPVRADCEGRTHIFNAVETCLVDSMPALLEIGFDSLAIDARGRTAAYARDMASLYTDAIDAVLREGDGASGRLAALKARIRERAIGGITTGHFLRGPLDA